MNWGTDIKLTNYEMKLIRNYWTFEFLKGTNELVPLLYDSR